jgi:hypothetical protein
MLTADSGFNASRVLTFQLSLPNSKYAEPVQGAGLHPIVARLTGAARSAVGGPGVRGPDGRLDG